MKKNIEITAKILLVATCIVLGALFLVAVVFDYFGVVTHYNLTKTCSIATVLILLFDLIFVCFLAVCVTCEEEKK